MAPMYVCSFVPVRLSPSLFPNAVSLSLSHSLFPSLSLPPFYRHPLPRSSLSSPSPLSHPSSLTISLSLPLPHLSHLPVPLPIPRLSVPLCMSVRPSIPLSSFLLFTPSFRLSVSLSLFVSLSLSLCLSLSLAVFSRP